MREWRLKTTRSTLPAFLLFDILEAVFTENELFMDPPKVQITSPFLSLIPLTISLAY